VYSRRLPISRVDAIDWRRDAQKHEAAPIFKPRPDEERDAESAMLKDAAKTIAQLRRDNKFKDENRTI